MSIGTYNVLNPLAPPTKAEQKRTPAPRLASLEGKTLGMLECWGKESKPGEGGIGPVFAAIRDALKERYGLADVVFRWKPNLSRPAPKSTMDDLKARVDMVVVGTAR